MCTFFPKVRGQADEVVDWCVLWLGDWLCHQSSSRLWAASDVVYAWIWAKRVEGKLIGHFVCLTDDVVSGWQLLLLGSNGRAFLRDDFWRLAV